MQRIAPHPKDLKVHLISAALSAVVLVGCSADEGPAGGITPVPTPVPVPVPVPVPTPVPTPNAPAPVIETLTATPGTVVAGMTTVIEYSASGAVSCEATGQWAGQSLQTSGNETVTVPMEPGVYSYGLTCTNETGQQTTRTVNVTVVSASGGGNDENDVVGGGDGNDLVNDGTDPTDVTDGPAGPPIAGNFICTSSGRVFGENPTTEVRINGLLGPQLTDLVNTLGGGTVTQLLNSVTAPESAVDRNLNTAAQFNLTAGLLTLPVAGNVVSSVDLFIGLNRSVPAGRFAVFGLTFPIATAELTLMQGLTVSTYQGSSDVVVETRSIDLTTLDLLGTVQLADPALYFGFKTTQPYDRVSISLDPTVISANVGNVMNVHELCTNGRFQVAP